MIIEYPLVKVNSFLETSLDKKKKKKEKTPSSPYGALIDELIDGAPSLRDAIDAVLQKENTPFKKNELKEAAIKIKEIFSE